MRLAWVAVLAGCASDPEPGPATPLAQLDRVPLALAGDAARVAWIRDTGYVQELWQLDGDLAPTQLLASDQVVIRGGLALIDHDLYFQQWVDFTSQLMRLTASGPVDTALGGADVELFGFDGTFVAQLALAPDGLHHEVRVRDPRPEGLRSTWEARYVIDQEQVAIGGGVLALASTTGARLVELGTGAETTLPFDTAHIVRQVVVVSGGVVISSPDGLYRVTPAGTVRLADDLGEGTLVTANGVLWFAKLVPYDETMPMPHQPALFRIDDRGNSTMIAESAVMPMISAAADRLLALVWDSDTHMWTLWRI